MKRQWPIMVLLILGSLTAVSQGLTKERIQKLRRCVGKITIQGTNWTGTGFFVSPEGEVLTCWHVIDSAIIYKDGKIAGSKKLFFELTDGSKTEIGISDLYLEKSLNKKAVSYDFCTLIPVIKTKGKRFDYYKFGDFDNVEEGDDIFTAGYPLGLSNQFISKGILSTKYIDSSLSLQESPSIKIKRTVALMDLTINRGNSGGPIIRLGKTMAEDELVGIADFLINPFGSSAEELYKALQKEKDLLISENVSLTKSLGFLAQAISYSTNGISGCISINHVWQEPK